MAKRVTISELARVAGVSVSTIDRILNKRGPVQRVTAEHVFSVARKIGFQGLPNLRRRLSEEAPQRTFGFLLNGRDRDLYNSFARALVDATQNSTRIRGKAIVRHLDDLSPMATAEALYLLGEECDAIGGVCVEHPAVNQAVRDLADRDKPFWSMLSDVTEERRAGFVGTNAWKLGRSAGWFMARLCQPQSKIAVLIGSSLYLGHNDYEAGFRSFMNETSMAYILLDTEQTTESDDRAYRIVNRLFDQHPDIGAIFIGGGGVDGIVRACTDRSRSTVAIVSTEISEMTNSHLSAGLVDVALSHEFARVALKVVQSMEDWFEDGANDQLRLHDVAMKVAIKESI